MTEQQDTMPESDAAAPDTAAAATVECRGLAKIYGAPRGNGERIVAVDNLDLSIGPGEVYGLIGPNGAGKTTLLRMIATLLQPTRGRVLVTGLDTDRDRERVCGRLGFVPDRFHLYEELKVWEYLEFFAIAYGCPRDERQKTIDSIIELTDLGVRRDSYCSALSKGMRQRLLLAKTLVHDPDLLVMDEPTDGMDPQARIEFRNIVRTLSKMGKTIIISSHLLADLSFFCTSIGIMESGRLLVGGTVDQVRRSLDLNPSVILEYLDPKSDVARVIRDLPGVSRVRSTGPGKARFDFDGSDEQRAAVLDALVRGGVQVLGFTYHESTLEEILLRVGASKVQ